MSSDTNQINERDRIAQAYLGSWGGTDTQERAKRRINWLAGQAEGEQVLDVGCSEGILALLLAREGFKVVGVDINQEALKYAEGLFKNEAESVCKRASFINGDLMAVEFAGDSFDTVILGELLEHLLHPALILERACHFLKPGGKLLVTTPFGYFPSTDHKQTFTLASFSALLKPFISPVEIAIEDGYIRFAGRKRENGGSGWDSFDDTFLLAISDKAIIEQQIFLWKNIERWKAAENKLRQEYRKNKNQIQDIKGPADKLTTEKNQLALELTLKERELNHQISCLSRKKNG
ncbi:hypothetical protein N752_30120 [Desulforamulus aquiferis]|nr:class I SAM-dependent methyltransferase [Desulforamulus aquiferis]RYD01255.1 hypothetical protein N752_30120 [Desulforamulus aquiferis]